ncbi:MAG: C-GCAxxG-C-C family protein [Clostridia bacterium]|nr:C-GCAxxG-C-C family protein [Clostridia bacterium]
MNKHIEKAMELRNEVPMRYNCAETLFLSYAEELGLSEETALGLAHNIGGGLGYGATCGAIVTGLIILGANGIKDSNTLKQYRRAMADRHDGLMNCKDLLSGAVKAGKDKKTHCDKMITDSIELIDEIIAARKAEAEE